MSRKDYVYAALRHEQPDLCPWDVDFTQKAYQRMVEYTGDPDFGAKVGNHIVHIAPAPMNAGVEVGPGLCRDRFGVVWNRTIDPDIGNPQGQVFPEPTLGDYRFPDPEDPAVWESFGQRVAAVTDQFVILNVDLSLFERAWTMRGMESLLMDMLEHPAFVDELLEAITEFNLAVIRRGAQFPIDGVHFGDDWGQQQGMIMGPQLWRRFLKPHLARLYGAVHEAGKYVFIHSCGQVQQLFPDLIEIGLDCFNPLQPEVMDVYEMKRLYGDRLSFDGGISTQRTLPYGTPEQVRAEVRRLISEIGKGGGYICAPAHSIPGDAQPENIMAMLETFWEQ
jgi:uroporphyrinogen decarboxylase